MSDTRSKILKNIAPEVREWCGSTESLLPSNQFLYALWQESYIRAQYLPRLRCLSVIAVNPLILPEDTFLAANIDTYGLGEAARLARLHTSRNTVMQENVLQEHVLTVTALSSLRQSLPSGCLAEVLEHFVRINADEKDNRTIQFLPELTSVELPTDMHVVQHSDPAVSAAVTTDMLGYERFFSAKGDQGSAVGLEVDLALRDAYALHDSSALFEAMAGAAAIDA